MYFQFVSRQKNEMCNSDINIENTIFKRNDYVTSPTSWRL